MDQTYENFKILGLAFEQYIYKAISEVKDIEDLQYLKVSSVNNLTNIFDNWDEFEKGMPVSIKNVFRKNTVSFKVDDKQHTIKYDDFVKLTKDIPMGYEAPVQTLEKCLKNQNIRLDKVSNRIRTKKGEQFNDMIRANTVSQIVRDVVNETSQSKVHDEYFAKLIEEDAEQFYHIKPVAEGRSDSQERKNALDCYNYVLRYKKACVEGIRKTLDSYESKLKTFMIKLAQKSRDEATYKKIATIMASFVNYKNNPQNFFQIIANMNVANKLRDKIVAAIGGEANRTVNIFVSSQQDLSRLFKKATQGIVDYINLDQGLLTQFARAMKSVIDVDFTELVLDLFINFIMFAMIKYNNNNSIILDLNTLIQDFSTSTSIGEMTRVRNVLYSIRYDNNNNIDMNYLNNRQLNLRLLETFINQINNNDNAKTILGLNVDQDIDIEQLNRDSVRNIQNNLDRLEQVLHNDISKNRTEYILYNMINNMIKSIYGTIILIIQAHSREEQNIYTLLGSSRRRLQGGVNVGVVCKEECFTAYILAYRLHKLFVQQAYRIFYRRESLQHGAYYDGLTQAQLNRIYSIIQITRTSKYYDLYKCFIKTNGQNIQDFDEYFKCINDLWVQIPGSTSGILSERTHTLLSQYVQELINNMVITLKTLNNPTTTNNELQTFNAIESRAIDGINTFDRITNSDEQDNRIIVESHDTEKADDVLELYMAINYQIQKFTDAYIQQNRDDNFQLSNYKNEILQELQRYKNIWLAKTENQGKLYVGGDDENLFKKRYLVSLISDNNLLQNIKTGYDSYREQFGLQYKQLKYIQLRIMNVLYSYHKQYVEKFNNYTFPQPADQNLADDFNTPFTKAVRYLHQQSSSDVYKYFLQYTHQFNDQAIAEKDLKYREFQLVQNSEFVKTKIYMFFLEQLETKIAQAIDGNPDFNTFINGDIVMVQVQGQNQRNQIQQTAQNLCLILVKLGIIEEYNPQQSNAYDKHQLPFMICGGQMQDPPNNDMVSNKDGDGNHFLYMIITKNFYNYYQQHNTYLKSFCVNTLEQYENSVRLLRCIPLIEIRNNEVDASALYKFLDDAKNAILSIYDKTNSIYTKQEIKDVIRHQLELSLDINPVLKDAFEKYVLPVQSYYNTIRYDLEKIDNGWFSTQNYKLHVFKLDEIKEQQIGSVRALINKATTSANGEEEVQTTYKSCSLLNAEIVIDRTKYQEGKVDHEIDMIRSLNRVISTLHEQLYKVFHTIPKEFREKVLSNDIIREYSELTDVQSGQTVFQLPLKSIQTPFLSDITQIDLEIKDKQTVIDNMLNMNEVDQYLNQQQIQYLTSSMIEFMVLTYGERPISYSRIPRDVKVQYIEFFNKIFNNEQLSDADLPDDFTTDRLFVSAYTNQRINVIQQLAGDLPDINAAINGVYGQTASPYVQLATAQNVPHDRAEQFVNNVNRLIQGYVVIIYQLAYAQNRVNNQAQRIQLLNNFVQNYMIKFNLVQLIVGMKSYRRDVMKQIKEGYENLYVPINNNWDTLKMIKPYSSQIVSYVKYDQTNNLLNEILNSVEYQRFDAQQRQQGRPARNAHIESKLGTYSDYLMVLVNRMQVRGIRPAIEVRQGQPQGLNNQNFGIADNELTQIDKEGPNNTMRPFLNQNIHRVFMAEIFKRCIDIVDAANAEQQQALQQQQEPQQQQGQQPQQQQQQNRILPEEAQRQGIWTADNIGVIEERLNNLVTVGSPIVVPRRIQTKAEIESKNILTNAYAKGFVDSVSKIISQYQETQQFPIIYNIKSQKIELFEQENYTAEVVELPLLQMNNILALSDDQEELTSISEDRKIELVYDLMQTIVSMKTSLQCLHGIQTPILSIYNTYISATQNLVDNYMSKFEWNKYLDKNFHTRYFNLNEFLILDQRIRQIDHIENVDEIVEQPANNRQQNVNVLNVNVIDVIRDRPLLMFKFLSLILLKGIDKLKSYDGKQLEQQVYKNFNFYVNMIMNNDYHEHVQQIINHTQFMRLAFVKCLTTTKRIIGQDHYWISNNQLRILRQQTTFLDIDQQNHKYKPDWQNSLENDLDYRNKLYKLMLSYGNEFMDVIHNELLVFDIRRIPYMQQYTQQPYVYSCVQQEMTRIGQRHANRRNNNQTEQTLQLIIPQHFMDEISQCAGLTNTSTLNVSVQLTFDLEKINRRLNIIGQLQNNVREQYLENKTEQFYELRRDISGLNVQNRIQNDFRTDPILFTYNIATYQNKTFQQVLDLQQNGFRNSMKLFTILNLQPFHPIQLIKDNSIYQIMTIFGIYVNKYESLYNNDNILIQNHENDTYKELNFSTKYGQKIYIKYHLPIIAEDNDQIRSNKAPMVLVEQGNRSVYYLHQENNDVIMEITYGNNGGKITNNEQLQHLLNRHDMSQYGIMVNDWKQVVLTQDEIFNGYIGDLQQPDAEAVDQRQTIIRQFNDNNHVRYQLVKYKGIVLDRLGPQPNNDDVVNINDRHNIPHLILQIFKFIKHYNKLIQTNDATEKQGITYSQYHVMVSDDATYEHERR